MTTLSFDRLEPWSYPVPHYTEQAQVWHARRYTKWLLRAGAEPRFGALLLSGTQALARWTLLQEEQGVEIVTVVSKLERPLPQALTDHQGDHFNRRLFIIDGLDEITLTADKQQAQNFWETLEGQRSQLKQLATWATLKISHPQTLLLASTFAPKLMAALDKVCWMWMPSEYTTSLPKVDLPQVKHGYLYELFCAATSFSDTPSLVTLGRIFRAGYMHPPKKAHELWKWGFRLWRGEVRDPRAARFGQVGVTEALPEHIEADHALWAYQGRGEAATPARKAQWYERALGSTNAWQLTAEAELPVQFFDEHSTNYTQELKQLHHWASTGYDSALSLSVATLQELEALIPRLKGELFPLACAVVEWLTQAYAQKESLEGCIRVNQVLSQVSATWPEAQFVAHERLLDLALFQRDFTQASTELATLESLISVLHSPLFEIRFLEAKAKQTGLLDPARGESHLKEAQVLGERFGGQKILL